MSNFQINGHDISAIFIKHSSKQTNKYRWGIHITKNPSWPLFYAIINSLCVENKNSEDDLSINYPLQWFNSTRFLSFAEKHADFHFSTSLWREGVKNKSKIKKLPKKIKIKNVE